MDNDFKWMMKNLTNFCYNTADLLNIADSDALMRGNIANFLANLVADKTNKYDMKGIDTKT